MAVMVKLKHVDSLPGGRKRFKRRIPTKLITAYGDEWFRRPMKAREGVALVAEWESLMAEFKMVVKDAGLRAAGMDPDTPLRQWEKAVASAEQMVSGVVVNPSGCEEEDEDFRRSVLAEALELQQPDPMLFRAVFSPSAPAPAPTLMDAKEVYLSERMAGATGRNQRNRLARVCGHLEAALGPLNKLHLADLKRAHGRKLRDYMLSRKKADGSPLAPDSIVREIGMIKAIVSIGLTEFDLAATVPNPFDRLEFPKTNDAALEAELGKRDPLPADVLVAMRQRMRGKLGVPALGLIWRMLEGTGCRGAEVVGLRREDVVLDGPYPHIWVRWHEDRRLKTAVSIRAVPLVGDALEAASEALKVSEGHTLLFPKYAYEAGPDAVSQALMKHLRKVTANKRHVVYSLRHNMKDWLIEAQISEREENRIMGHTMSGIGDRVYGGGDARLKVMYEAMEKAVALIPS
ncbi:tyrosine-type recombinase/integrase [Roseinatronobacter sp.]|uniref:tyrosine-type recombinase/integrase n=1 Tax=Roseinatronobacter sp. TaxID=1945755 RepID=UPI003F70468F